MSSTRIRFVAYSIIVIVSLVFIEVISLSTFAVYHIVLGGKSLSNFKEIISSHYSNIYGHNSATVSGDYDPVTQMQYPANFSASDKFTINEFGFLSNGSEVLALNGFPDKNDKTIRVIILGGSSLFGSGVDSSTKTIPANLERIINLNYSGNLDHQKKIQVLNFGHPGAHTSIELAKLSQYLIHLEPDVVISFDGFNDAWYAMFEHKRQPGRFPHGVINWADYSYFYYDILSGGAPHITGASFGLISYLLPTTSSLVASAYNKLNHGDLYTKMAEYPPFKLSKFIHARDGDFADGLLTNYAAMGGLACAKGIAFWGVLQPHALEYYQYLTNSEKDKISSWEQIYGKYTNGRTGYANKMAALYDKYEAGLSELNERFSHCSKVNFISLRNIFSTSHDVDIYVDNIHYTEEGNKRLAAEMAELLNKSLSN